MKETPLLLRLFFLLLITSQSHAWNDSKLTTPVVINDLTIPYPVFSMFFMPNQEFTAQFKDLHGDGNIEFNGEKIPVGSQPLVAPDTAGRYPLRIFNDKTKEEAIINIFVLVPASKIDEQGKLNGYNIGQYPKSPLKGDPIYNAPKGFIEVNKDDINFLITPNFTLGAFLSKQNQGFPKYLILRAGLLLKLENILATLNREGTSTKGFVIMSGYRTPWYNKAIGNVPYSRHAWGGAADIYIDDNPRDGNMDDLNKDGKIDRKDAVWLANFIEKMSRRGDFGPRIGGLGIYGSNSAHGPFVHIDVRGARARW